MSRVVGYKRVYFPLVVIIAIAAIFYFWHLGRADIITDESSYATRAIGLVDFDFGIEQPTPWQWVNAVPWWMHLSFHDHPPLVFLLEHYSIKFFGENPIAIRLPSVLAGLAAVVFVYLIGAELYSTSAGFTAAALFAFSVNHVWISRIGLQESTLIALMLASVYCFLRAIRPSISMVYTIDIDKRFRRSGRAGGDAGGNGNPRWLLVAASFLGLAFLAKYLALILIPIFLTILFIKHRNLFASRYFILSILLFFLVAAPVIIYNYELYRNFGHFDFQFSLLFRQNVKEWQARPGQEALGSYTDRVKDLFPSIFKTNSPLFLLAALAGLIISLVKSFQERSARPHLFLFVGLAWLLLFFVFVGPAYRFLTILTPWLALAAGYGLGGLRYSHILKNMRISVGAIGSVLLLTLVLLEALYSYNSVITLNPIGKKPWLYSDLYHQTDSWGFNELNQYIDQKFSGKMPAAAITFEYPFAKNILDKTYSAETMQGFEPVPWAVVYNDNINLSAQLWVFLRRIVYGGWPVATAEAFRNSTAVFFKQVGVKQVIFVNSAPAALQDRPRPPTKDGDALEDMLLSRGAKADEIKNLKGEVAFRVYEFDLK